MAKIQIKNIIYIYMELKFIILMIGLFLFVLGYVNQNKYNCNIIPSLDKRQHQDLKDLFYDKNIKATTKIQDYTLTGGKISRSEYDEASYLGRAPEMTSMGVGGVSVADNVAYVGKAKTR